MINLSYAPDAFKGLNGIFCIYKPCGIYTKTVRNTLCYNLCRDLNELAPRENNKLVCLNGSVYSNKPFEVQVVPNLAEHKLVSGPYYQPQDIRMKLVSNLGKNTSGVFLMAINDGCRLLRNPMYSSFLRKYQIRGKFGIATDTFMLDGKVIERSTCSHVKLSALERVLADIQATHQNLVFDYLSVDIQSQAAYELASKGLVKPSGKSCPLIYSIKCTEFKLPYFTIEVQCINESETFLAEVVHDIGIDLKTNAVCKQLQQIQFGMFTLSHALLRKHWTLENILNNIALCQAMLEEEKLKENSENTHHIRPLQNQKNLVEVMQDKIREEYLE